MHRWLCTLLTGIVVVVGPHLPVSAEEDGSSSSQEVEVNIDPSPDIMFDLDRLKAIALEENPSLHAAQERVEQARARVRQSRASFFPEVGLSASVTKTWQDRNTYDARRRQAFLGALQGAAAGGARTSTGAPATWPLLSTLGNTAGSFADAIHAREAIDRDSTAYTAALNAQWLLFDGFAREFSHAATRMAVRESEAALDDAKRLLLSFVASSYHAALLAREDITIAEVDEDFNQRQLIDAQARRRVGTGSLSDELNFEVRVNQARSTRIRAERIYAVALIGLAELLGLPEGLPEEAVLAPLEAESDDLLVAPDTEQQVALAFDHRPDRIRSEYAIDRTEAQMRARRGAFYPTLTANASHSARWLDTTRFSQDDFDTAVGVVLSYPLFAGGANRARYMEARSVHREARHDLTTTELGIAADVREAIAQLRAAQEELGLQQENAAFVERNRDLVEREYDAGQASLTRLNEAQRDYINAQGQLAAARVAVRQAWHDLETATGAVLLLSPESP